MLIDGQAVEVGARVAIRVDGSTEIGSGHVQRCLALAQALRRAGAEVRFVMRDLGVSFGERIAAHGFGAALLPRPAAAALARPSLSSAEWARVPVARDADETVAALSDWHPDWTLVDHYGLAAEWHRSVGARLACRVAVIDDLGDRPLAAAIVVDHNLNPDHRAKYAASRDAIGRLLGGPRYALLSKAYRDAPTYRFHHPIRSVGIFMGGVDRDDYTSLCLTACRAAGFAGPIEIVTTTANPNLDALRRRAADDGRVALEVDLPDLASFFARHDLQIGAGGGASWERCRMGAPAIVVQCADNQAVVTAGLREADAALTVDAPIERAIAAAVATLQDPERRERIAGNAARLVDGRGAERVAMAMLADRLTVRPAGLGDAATMLAWRNAPEVRAVSRQRGEIAFDDHVAWLTQVLADPDRHLLLGSVGAVDVGVLRYDRLAPGEWEVSIYLDPALPGLGLGGHLLAAGEAWLARRVAGPFGICAEFLDTNLASRIMFERGGFSGKGNRVWKSAVGRAGEAGRTGTLS